MTVNLEFYQGNGFIAEVIRTNRIKTATVKVDEGKVSVVIPKNLSDSRIKELVTNKTRWIREKILIHRQSAPSKPKEYVSGESFTYLGRNYRLKVETGKTKSVKLKNGKLIVTIPKKSPEKIQDALTQWYREHAEQKLREKSERYSKLIGIQPKSISIKTFKSRWGSCHSNGDVQFNWKIIIAPNRIVDYVVVHEICHMKQHNHSPKFWKCVEKIFPDYLECKGWLKENGKYLKV
ncbi:MAG: SprT family zinc-dependent metalloprotease [Candidatus Thiodiazotropha sp.]